MLNQRLVGSLDDTGHACVISQPMPELKKGCVLVKVHASLISPGTELVNAKKVRGDKTLKATKTTPFGYQNAGEVIAVGDGVVDFKVGDRVSCIGAGFAQHANYAVVPQRLCCLMPDNVSWEEGAYVHLVVTALQALRRSQPEIGENLLVVGMGVVGQCAARLGQLAGAYVMGWDFSDFRLDVAAQWGIDATIQTKDSTDWEQKCADFTRKRGFDMAIMAFGGDGSQTLQNVAKVMKITPDTHHMGRITLVGGLTTTCSWGAPLGNLDLRCSARSGPGYHDAAWETGETSYPDVFVRWTTRSNMELALRYISEKKLSVTNLTTHRLPLRDIDVAVAAHIENPNSTLGTILLMDH
ncbi:MAG: zinc-binding dehydrogenase [Victivallales bacterium]|nr:zinc-binding dehydrogenase [Victivallales bacterium]